MKSDKEFVPNGEKSRQNKRKKGKILKRILLILLALILLGIAGFIAYSKLRAEYTVTYQEYNATIGTISNSLSFSGSLQLIDSKTYTADKESTVRSVFVSEGDAVTKGQRILRLQNGQIVEADFSGRVNRLPVAVGDTVEIGDTLAQIADFIHQKVSVRVDEYDINNVHRGDECTITTTATEQTFTSKIDSINYISSSTGNVAYYEAIAYVEVDGGVYPGMQVTLTVPRNEAADVVILKADALGFDVTNQAFVYKKNAEGEMQQVQVEIGVSNGNYVEVISGVSAGESVFARVKQKTTDPTYSLMSGMFGRTYMRPSRSNGSGSGSSYGPGQGTNSGSSGERSNR